MANPKRLLFSWDEQSSAVQDSAVIETSFELLSGDLDIRVRATVSLGVIGVRLDGDTSDRATIDGSTPIVEIDVSGDVAGVRVLRFFARGGSATVNYGEITMLHR